MKKLNESLRDSYVHVSDELVPILDSHEVQRLRQIDQLGFSSLVYSDSTHTRFAHTKGVLWMTKNFMDSLGINDEVVRRRLKIASILHDTGHGPYSHAIESVDGVPKHEKRSCEIVEGLAKRNLIQDEDVKPVKQYITGDRKPHVLSGDIDSDRMDYLVRDAHHTGIPHGSIDTETILEAAKNIKGEIVFEEMAIQAIESLLVARKNMHRSVYSHPTVRSAERMLTEAVERAPEVTPENIYEFTDYTLHSELTETDNQIARELFTDILDRNLYKTAFCLRRMHNTTVDNKENFESELRDSVDLQEHELFIDWYDPDPGELDINVLVDGDIVDFNRTSGASELIENDGYAVLMSVYTPAKYEDKVESEAKKLLGL